MNNEPNSALVTATAKGEPYTTSEIIAQGIGVTHKWVKRSLRKYIGEFESFGKVVGYATTLDSGQESTGYQLNEQQATFLLTLLKNTPVVVAFKKELVRQFYAMRELIRERSSPIWRDVRALGKEIRKREADAIREFVAYAEAQGSRNAERYYTAFSLLADRTAGVEDRDKAPAVQLVALLNVEQVIAGEIRAGIEAGSGYRDIYQAAKDRLTAVGAVLNIGGDLLCE